ncbi:hypothetical protein [Clostridium merdae]|uniref:hypothetical protein n=1 Tax=Clostridium merdae TaxID=1958780 RepID=UPI000A26B5D8|nr:hypothetical protein [Clostridium merdae]
MPTDTKKIESDSEQKNTCFVIMPISDPEGYASGHFHKIYTQLFAPAIEEAGFKPHRVDEDKSSDSIQLKILHELIDAPMVLCDLSTRNPNVLYELGIRQAFDKPVVLVQEIGTQRIFDINGIATTDYRSGRIYDEIIEDRKKIIKAIEATASGKNFGSIIKLLGLNSAELKTGSLSPDDTIAVVLQGIMNDIGSIKSQIQNTGAVIKFDSELYNDVKNVLRINKLSEDEKLQKQISELDYTIKNQVLTKNQIMQCLMAIEVIKNEMNTIKLNASDRKKYSQVLDEMQTFLVNIPS